MTAKLNKKFFEKIQKLETKRALAFKEKKRMDVKMSSLDRKSLRADGNQKEQNEKRTTQGVSIIDEERYVLQS